MIWTDTLANDILDAIAINRQDERFVAGLNIHRETGEWPIGLMAWARGVVERRAPRCDGCKHWEQSPYNAGLGECELTVGRDCDGSKVTHPKSKAHASVGGDEFDAPALETVADFGCVQWEAK